MLLKTSGANKTRTAVTRVGRSIGTLSPMLDQFDRETVVKVGSSKYKKQSAVEDIAIAVEELVASQVFSIKVG